VTNLPKVAVFTLGGTIASVPSVNRTDAIPKLGAEDLLAAVPGAADVADLTLRSFRQYPSGDLTICDIITLARQIEAVADTVDGVMITQGTDTLEETSFLLSLLLQTEIPVVLTGAMRNSGLPGADGAANMLHALLVAGSPDAVGIGPVVVIADKVHLARHVRKVHSSSIAAFESPNSGPVGWINEDRVRIPLMPRASLACVALDAIDADHLPEVEIASVALGSTKVCHGEPNGLVVQGFGGGHVPSRTVPELEALAECIPVVLASRTGAGEIYSATYGFPGSERDLLGRGLISAGALDAYKARLLLTTLLASNAERNTIVSAFERF
jgi:L-asparaginase